MIILYCDFVFLYLNDVIYRCLDDSMDRAVGTRHPKTFFKKMTTNLNFLLVDLAHTQL